MRVCLSPVTGRALLATLVLQLCVVAGGACGNGDDGGKDVGPEAGLDGGSDAGSDAETAPPDQGADLSGDTGLEPDGPLLESNMGEGCSRNVDCKAGSPDCLMFDTDRKLGICSRECKQDDPNTPLFNEDTCPDGFLCGSFQYTSATYNYCLEICTPSLTTNPCPASSKTTCHPASTRFSDNLAQAICFFPACSADTDCPVVSATPCGTSADCASVSSDAFCEPETKRCARPGKCTPGGLCGPHDAGNDVAKVGDPCKSDLDCPGNGICLAEEVDASTVYYRNGYCAVRFCSFASQLKDFACPDGSACHNLFYGGLCHQSCSLDDVGGCRNHAGDFAGDYECYAWNNLFIGGEAVTATPVCQSAAGQTCDSLGTQLDCSSLGLEDNATHMRCRDPKSGADLPTADPAGLCLDDTTSGSFQSPAGDGGAPDAALPDAALPDVALPDAALPDAALPDSAAPDAGVDAAPADAASGDVGQDSGAGSDG